MIGLFVALSVLFIALIFMREQRLLVAILERVAQSSPIYFMIASVYFENRFEFYDLVVKRALLILLSVIVLGVFLAVDAAVAASCCPAARRGRGCSRWRWRRWRW